MGWSAFVVPFLFVFSPVLVLQDFQTADLVFALGTAIAGVWLVCAGITGYFVRPLGMPMKAAFTVAGILLMTPRDIVAWGLWLDLAGLALGMILIAVEYAAVRRERRATQAQ